MLNTVFVLIESGRESDLIYGLYTTRKKAEEALANLAETYRNAAIGWVKIIEVSLNTKLNG